MVNISGNSWNNFRLSSNNNNNNKPNNAKSVEVKDVEIQEFELGEVPGEESEPCQIWPFITNFLLNFGWGFDPLGESDCNSRWYKGKKPPTHLTA